MVLVLHFFKSGKCIDERLCVLTLRPCGSAARGENQLPFRFVVLVQISDLSFGQALWVYRGNSLPSPLRGQDLRSCLAQSGRNRRSKLREVGPDRRHPLT